MRSSVMAAAASLSTTLAAIQGFNYGATKSDASFNYQADFEEKFSNAQNLVGTSGFTSARLYTMIQGGSSTNEPTQAIPAAISTKTTLLLGLWASGGLDGFQAEITALESAISQYGTDFTDLVVGISVGSEDLYRISPTGALSGAGTGASPDEIVNYIGLVKTAIAGTSLSAASIGHVDTWTSWVNGSNAAVIEAVDWLGFDGYPYFQNTQTNGIDNAKQLFLDSVAATKAAAGDKEIWITETGWPVSGPTENLAIASTANAETYWKEVGCPLFGVTNTWWYTQQDADTTTTPSPSFGLVGYPLSTTPLYNLTCSAVNSSASASATSSIAGSVLSSIQSVATQLPASSGVGLAPTQVAPVYSSATSFGTAGSGGYATPTGSTGSSSGSGSSGSGSGNSTAVVTPTLSSTGSGSSDSAATSTLASVSDSAAGVISGSFMGVAVAALVAAFAAL
ncbi:glycoside hydrolase superfamily [Calycina marina]|uniref:Probable glucan endo-1,3-beta-glucosidase eglC n=1 Tax=Calycina marina TaxID=1763456 RepID=A0A9P8CJP6_9HELO|nr:glycoside hydrolase superfamily [Calycina marina]